MLARRYARHRARYTYRFFFIPGTIGSIAWLARNEDRVSRVRHGLVLSCLGDAGGITYKQSRRGDAAIDRIVEHVAPPRGEPTASPLSPLTATTSGNTALPASTCRSAAHALPERDLSGIPHLRRQPRAVGPESLAGSPASGAHIVEILEGDGRIVSRNPKASRSSAVRALSPTGGYRDPGDDHMALLWVLNLADGRHSLLDTAERAGLPFATIRAAADRLEAADLVQALP